MCWSYRDPQEFLNVALEYVADGLMLGERVLCVVDETAREALLRLDPSHLSIGGASGPALAVYAIDEVYDPQNPKPLEQQLSVYDTATQRAIAEGYSGLRVLAEVTGLVVERSRWATQLRWERLADEYLSAGRGATALCAYRSDIIDPQILDDLSCVHPLIRFPGRQDSFRLFFDAGRLALAGIINVRDCEQLRRMLTAAPEQPRPEVDLDMSLVRELDDTCARLLLDWAGTVNDSGSAVHVIDAPDSLYAAWVGGDVVRPTNVTMTPRGRVADRVAIGR